VVLFSDRVRIKTMMKLKEAGGAAGEGLMLEVTVTCEYFL
jgi:hypothetical protein